MSRSYSTWRSSYVLAGKANHLSLNPSPFWRGTFSAAHSVLRLGNVYANVRRDSKSQFDAPVDRYDLRHPHAELGFAVVIDVAQTRAKMEADAQRRT